MRIAPHRCQQLFPAGGSSRGCRAGESLNVLVPQLIEGGRCLEDGRHLHAGRGLMPLSGIRRIPKAGALGRRRLERQCESAADGAGRPQAGNTGHQCDCGAVRQKACEADWSWPARVYADGRPHR